MASKPMTKQVQVGFLLAAIRRRQRQAVEARVSHLGLSSQQFWLLETVFERGKCTLGEILSRLPMDQPTASRVLAALHKRGLVEIESDQDDRRRRCVRLTSQGKRLAARCAGVARRIRGSVLAGFSRTETATLSRYLARMVTNLDRLDAVLLSGDKTLAKGRASGSYRSRP
jgi:DNA-binding MarR family transcriptional regulator